MNVGTKADLEIVKNLVTDEDKETLNILVVDDEPIARMILSRPLIEVGHKVFLAGGGNEALTIMQAHTIDLILLDLQMRDGDGFMVLESLRTALANRWVPVIVTSGHQAEEKVLSALDHGADDYMIKPVNIRHLKYKIRNYRRVINLQSQNLNLLAQVTKKQQSLERLMQSEYQLSTRIQKTLLFGSIPHSPGGVFTSARATAARGINGDFIEIFSVYPDSVDMILGDVMGKGAIAAIQGADVKLQVQRQISQHLAHNRDERFTVAQIVNAIHHTLTPKLIELESFVTLLYIRLDKANRKLTVLCCGHPSPVLLSRGKGTPIGKQHMPLGVLADELYEEQVYDVDLGDAVIGYSDGLSEAQDALGEAYGDERLLEVLEPFHQAHWGANTLAEVINASVMQFLKGESLRDDMTMVLAKLPEQSSLPIRLQLPRKIEMIGELRQYIADFAQQKSIPDEVVDRMVLVIVETFTNIVRHSATEIINSSIEVLSWIDDGKAWIRIESMGPYFDPVKDKDEELGPIGLDREGGFGLHIINALSDQFLYAHAAGVNQLDFAFNLP